MNWLFRSRTRELEAENARLAERCASLQRQVDDLALRLRSSDAQYVAMYAENRRMAEALKAARYQPGVTPEWVQKRTEGVK